MVAFEMDEEPTSALLQHITEALIINLRHVLHSLLNRHLLLRLRHSAQLTSSSGLAIALLVDAPHISIQHHHPHCLRRVPDQDGDVGGMIQRRFFLLEGLGSDDVADAVADEHLIDLISPQPGLKSGLEKVLTAAPVNCFLV
jgi:hypothetical protein